MINRSVLIESLQRFALSDEVSKLTGYPQQHIPTYVQRGKVPQPLGKLGRYHVWDREELVKWAKANFPQNFQNG